MSIQWFVKVGRIKHVGPFTTEELQQMLEQRKLQPATQVCREVNGQPDGRWAHASTVTGLLPHIPRDPGTGGGPINPPKPDPVPEGLVEVSHGLGRPALLAIWSGVFLIFLIGVAIVFWINGSFDERQNERDHQVAVLLKQAKKELAANHLKEAKEAAIEAKKIPGSESDAEIEQLLDSIEKRQTFLDTRLEELVKQAEDKLAANDLESAKKLANRASKITLASNYDQARSLAAKIRGIEQERRNRLDDKKVEPSKPKNRKTKKKEQSKQEETKTENPFEDTEPPPPIKNTEPEKPQIERQNPAKISQQELLEIAEFSEEHLDRNYQVEAWMTTSSVYFGRWKETAGYGISILDEQQNTLVCNYGRDKLRGWVSNSMAKKLMKELSNRDKLHLRVITFVIKEVPTDRGVQTIAKIYDISKTGK